MNLDAALATFLDESRELLAQMETILLATENGDEADLHALFRAAHTIKGSAGLFGLDAVVAFTHHVESVLDRLRNGEIAFDASLIGLLMECRDHIAALVAAATSGGEAGDGRLLEARLAESLGAPPVTLLLPSAPAGAAAEALLVGACGGGVVGGADHWHLSLRFGAGVLQNGMDPLSFIRYLSSHGRIVHLVSLLDALPTWDDYDPESCYLGFEVDLESEASKAEIESVFDFVRDDANIRILPPHSKVEEYVALIHELAEDDARIGEILVAGGSLTRHELDTALAAQRAAQAPPSAPMGQPLGALLVDTGVVHAAVVDAAVEKQKRGEEKRAREAMNVKVPSLRLDQLIDLVGELVIAGAATQLQAELSGQPPLREAAANLLRLVEDIRDISLKLRMVPVGEVFARFPRVVRDVARELGKDIALVVNGAETELDKSLVEKIADPLTHMVRNAMDHGIEPVVTRLANGKTARGTVCLNAYHESGSIVIEVADDGGGLDSERILQKARERGLVAPDQVLTQDEIFRLILEPGFSTAAQVTNLSGRGVGMDVVKSSVEAMRGSLDIESEPGRGTTMRICLPLTLAIIDGFQVALGESVFILPLELVVECIEYPAETASDYLNLRGEVLPLVRLAELLAVEAVPEIRQSVVVVSHGRRKAGLLVDRLLGETQAVIKPLGRLFEKVRGISGYTIRGSGEVALILDVPTVIQCAAVTAAAPLHS